MEFPSNDVFSTRHFCGLVVQRVYFECLFYHKRVGDASASKSGQHVLERVRFEIERLFRPLVHGDWAQLVRQLRVALGRRLYLGLASPGHAMHYC